MKETIEEFIDKLFSRAEIPDYAMDAKAPLKGFIKSLLQSQTQKLSKQMADAIEVSKVGWIDEGRERKTQDFKKKIEGMNLDFEQRSFRTESGRRYDKGYNQALSDLLEELEI